MSTELSNYLSEMNKVYDEALSNIKNQKDLDSTKSFLTLLLDNNAKIKPYVVHLFIGTGILNEEDNRKALQELLKKHTEFMNFVWSI
jgi:hypothetical protein